MFLSIQENKILFVHDKQLNESVNAVEGVVCRVELCLSIVIVVARTCFVKLEMGIRDRLGCSKDEKIMLEHVRYL